MAKKRMFSLEVVDTDLFLEMPVSSQNLYFHLSMRADDDGFISSPNKIIKISNSSKNDFDILLLKSFIIPFESGICVVKHWRMNNYLRGDRYVPTVYQDELKSLSLENDIYTRDASVGLVGIPVVRVSDTQVRLGKDRIEENRIEKNSDHVKKSPPPSLNEVIEYFEKNGYSSESGKRAHGYYEAGDWHNKDGKKVINRKQTMINVRFKQENIKQNKIMTSEVDQDLLSIYDTHGSQ